MKKTISTSLALSLVVLSVAPAASAQPSEGAAGWAKSQGNRAGIELDILSSSSEQSFLGASIETSALALGITATGQINISGRFHLDIELPTAYGSISGSTSAPGLPDTEESRGGFLFGNPSLGFHYTAPFLDDGVLALGLSASIPVVQDAEEDLDKLIAIGTALPARAFFDVQRLAPETFTLKGRVGAEIRVLPMLYYRGDLAPELLIPTGDGDTEFFIEQGNELEVRGEAGFGGGLRFQEVFMLTEDDGIQTAVEPFIGYEPAGPGVYARAGFLVALDEELGFGLDQGKVATVRLAVGGKF